MSLLQRCMWFLADWLPNPWKAWNGWWYLPTHIGQPEEAGFLEHACPLGLPLLPADAHVYPGWAGGTWMLRLVLRNLDSCPWTATNTPPSRLRRNAEHVAAARMLQVSNLVFLVRSAKLASVTLHDCHLPFRSPPCDSFLNNNNKRQWKQSVARLQASLNCKFP